VWDSVAGVPQALVDIVTFPGFLGLVFAFMRDATKDAWHDKHMNLSLTVILDTRLCYTLLLLLSLHPVLQVSTAGFQSLREQRLPWSVFHQRHVRKHLLGG